MNFTSIKYFLVVCQEMNITKAAKKLYMTQQSLSEHISRLEKEYNVKLFERTPQFRLTYAGQQLRNFAEESVSLEKQIQNEMADIAQEKKGFLSIGIRPSYSRILLPEVISKFHTKLPNVHLNITIDMSSELIPQLLNSQLDLIYASGRNLNNSHIESIKLIDDFYCMIIPENILINTLQLTPQELKAGKRINSDYLAEIPLLMTQEGNATRTASEKYLQSLGVQKPLIMTETADLETNFLNCANGIGITFSFYQYYRHFIKTYRSPYTLYAVPINPPDGAPTTMIMYSKDRYISNAAREFIAISKEVAQKLASEK